MPSQDPDPRIAKLPAWAQGYIKDLKREREVAIRSLNECLDAQTPSRIYYEEYVSTGEQQGPSLKRFNVQTHKITVNHAGLILDVYAHEPDCIRLQWGAGIRAGSDAAMIPYSGQSVRLVAKEHMR